MQKFTDWLKGRIPRKRVVSSLPKSLKIVLGIFPYQMNNESRALKKVLISSQWNMSYGVGNPHEELEESFAAFVGTNYAIAVASGGMGIQMSLRALGLARSSEVLMQVDTCAAVPMSVLNAQTIPRFYDANSTTFLSDLDSVQARLSPKTEAIIASHLWGNPDDIEGLSMLARNSDAYLIEDCCLALGTTYSGKHVGTTGKVGVFSFGSTKPIQAGEGGIIVTNDDQLAKELRAMRHWGERTKDYGIRDVNQLSWNGRISEFSAAIAIEQLKGFPNYLERIRENVSYFAEYLSKNKEIGDINLGNSKSLQQSSFSQLTLTLNAKNITQKTNLVKHFTENGISVFHANFEPVPSLSLFKSGEWEQWMDIPSWNAKEEISAENFKNSYQIYNFKGIGISRSNFQSKYMTRKLIQSIQTFNFNT